MESFAQTRGCCGCWPRLSRALPKRLPSTHTKRKETHKADEDVTFDAVKSRVDGGDANTAGCEETVLQMKDIKPDPENGAPSGNRIAGKRRWNCSSGGSSQRQTKSSLRPAAPFEDFAVLATPRFPADGAVLTTSLRPRDFLGVTDNTYEISLPDFSELDKREPKSGLYAIRRLLSGSIVANRYRIDSRHRTGKGCIRTAVEIASGELVTLHFCKDSEILHKSLELYQRVAESSCACRLVERLDSHEALPDCLVLERGQYTLDTWLRSRDISEKSKLEALKLIATSVAELHSLGIVHCDISPSNLTFFPEQQRWKFLNLDSALLVNTVHKSTLTSGAYAPPERLLADSLPSHPAEDMWSFGAIAYELLTGTRLHDEPSSSQQAFLATLITSRFSQKLNSIPGMENQQFVKDFLNLNATERSTASEACNLLSKLDKEKDDG